MAAHLRRDFATAVDALNFFHSRYGCCSDYMLVMLTDITDWLRQEQIPYFITYGTLLGAELNARERVDESRAGAVRQNDILPWTQAGRKEST